MRIGILTYHRSLNNGAFIQCYSLFKRLKNEFPEAEVEVIDYTSPKIERLYPLTIAQYFRGYTTPKVFLSRLKRYLKDTDVLKRNKQKKEAFESCLSQLKLSDRMFYHESLQEIYDYIDKTYDLVVVGSDAVWNYTLRGFPNPYFLNSGLKVKKVSYAASCFGLNYENITENEQRAIKDSLDSFSFLGVRDDETAKFLSKVKCSVAPLHTCDPTVFLDVNDLPIDKKAFHEKLKSAGFSFERDTIGIMGTNEMCTLIRSMYGDKYQLVSLFNYCKDADVNLYHITPFEWAYVFRLFRLTMTTYFHGTLLSLRNGVPVICIALEEAYTSNHESKVEDFLRRVEYSDCYYHLSYIKDNIQIVRSQIDSLISSDSKKVILERMDKEAKTSNIFLDQIKR